jgi:hypothetical protein
MAHQLVLLVTRLAGDYVLQSKECSGLSVWTKEVGWRQANLSALLTSAAAVLRRI